MTIGERDIEFRAMLPGVAREIADTWRYPAPYDFYDANSDLDDYHEFVDSRRWPEFFYGAYVDDELIGFFLMDVSGVQPEISLGMRPDLTGHGLGHAFVDACISQALLDLGSERTLGLTVASFNQRAIRVYEAVGFVKTRSFVQTTNGGSFPFVEMIREGHAEPK